MKYIVQVNDEQKSVSIDADGLVFETETPVHAELTEIERTPVRMVRIGMRVERVVEQKR